MTLRLGQPKPKPAGEPTVEPTLVKILDDSEIDAATSKELRAAYRELRALHECRLEALIGERVKEVLRRLRKENKKTGGHRPLGYVVDENRVLQPDKRERQIARIAKQQRDQDMSLRKIAAYLESLGFVARNGKKFEASQIKRFIERADTFTEGQKKNA